MLAPSFSFLFHYIHACKITKAKCHIIIRMRHVRPHMACCQPCQLLDERDERHTHRDDDGSFVLLYHTN